jgi:hypothetical protein
MKRNIIKFTGLAMISALALTACHPDRVKEEAGMAAVLSLAIRNAASGNCAISLNNASLYYGAIVYHTVNNTNLGVADQGFLFSDYNAATGSSLTAAEYASSVGPTYNQKYDAFFTTTATWTTTNRNARLATQKTRLDIASASTQQLVGTGTLTCSRIPRTSCSVTGVTTATRAADLTNQVGVYNELANNGDCRKTDSSFLTAAAKYIFRGAPSNLPIQTTTGIFTNTSTNGTPQDVANSRVSQLATILPEYAYPKFGSLVSLGFGNVMPINKNGVAYTTDTASTTSTAFHGGTNLAVTAVDTCEGIGMEVAPTATATTKKPLTSAAEISYTLSQAGTAASTYATLAALGGTIDSGANVTTFTSPTASTDGVECNRSFRSKFNVSVALGGGKLGVSNSSSGDGGGSILLSSCIYGGTTAKRAIAQASIGAGLVAVGFIANTAQLPTCGEGIHGLAATVTAQQAAASAFTEVGSYSTFPNSN